MSDRVRALVADGACGLAAHILDGLQNKASVSKADWMKWERLRVQAYQAGGLWKALAARANALIPGLPRAFVNWLVTQSAEAELQADDGAGARRLLRRLLWQPGETPSADRARWRRLVIRSYLVDNQIDDARVALLRYMQDYPAQRGEWQVLRATVLLRTKRDADAFRVLAGADTDEAQLLRLYSALHIHAYKISALIGQVTDFAQEKHLDPSVQRKAWILLAQAADAAGDAHLRALALEHALILPSRTDTLSPFFPVSADDLWKAYDQVAEQRGNRDRLLVGNDGPWLREARAAIKNDPVLARSLYAFLVTHASSSKVRAESNLRLAASLYQGGGSLAVTALYLSSKRAPPLETVPTSVRVSLFNKALQAHDIKMEARLMKNFARPPRGQDANEWVLRRALTLVYAGDSASAVALLDSLLKSHLQFPAEFARHVKFVVLDLDAAGHHKQAARLLQSLYDRVSDPTLRRNLLYWAADARSSAKQYEDAAELYLRSAAAAAAMGPGGDNGYWIQAARFHAAEALADAGLVDDARNVYTALLRVTADPAQRIRLQRKIDQLWLRKRVTVPSATSPVAVSGSAPTAAH